MYSRAPRRAACPSRMVGQNTSSLGNVWRIPDLLGNHPAIARERFHRLDQSPRLLFTAGGEFVMSAFAGEQRPGTTDSRSVERRAICVFAVAIVVVSMPARAVRRFDLQ